MFDLSIEDIGELMKTPLKDCNAIGICSCSTSLEGYYKILATRGIKGVCVRMFAPVHVTATTFDGREIVIPDSQWDTLCKQMRSFKHNGKSLTQKKIDEVLYKNFVILNIAHASTFIPDEARDFIVPPDILRNEALQLADLYTDELIEDKDFITRHIAPVSRVFVDTERFLDDTKEQAARYGMGVFYTNGISGIKLRDLPSVEQREALLQKYYYPHHNALNKSVNGALSVNGRAMIIDLHSYNNNPEPFPLQGHLKPDICLGFDDFHCDLRVLETIVNWAFECGYRCALNNPYAGAIVPLEHYRKTAAVKAVMLAINKSLYMDEITLQKHDGFYRLKKNLNILMDHLC